MEHRHVDRQHFEVLCNLAEVRMVQHLKAVVGTGDVRRPQLEFQQTKAFGLQIFQQRNDVTRVFFRHVEGSKVLGHGATRTTVATALEHFQSQVEGLGNLLTEHTATPLNSPGWTCDA
ncbi:hypothetical protein D3C71_1502410 [compost metagenome]